MQCSLEVAIYRCLSHHRFRSRWDNQSETRRDQCRLPGL